ncbi:hypothetical protein EMMF5_001189 [Cystobasidiomycetes sp. EMM_F5]
MSARVADILHRSFVTVLVGVSVVGLAEIGVMHRNIMQQGRDVAAQKEMVRVVTTDVHAGLLMQFGYIILQEDLKTLRDNSSPQAFPEGTDLQAAQYQQPSASLR